MRSVVLRSVLCLLSPLVAGCAASAGARLQTVEAGPRYLVWVASESADQVSLIAFDGRTLEILERKPIGMMPVEIDGPHGVFFSPDGEHVYVTLGHGMPAGWLLKLDASNGEVVGRTPLGSFPATVSVTPDGRFGFVSNFNLHGDHVPSSISKVDLEEMTEVARTETCVMPHGSRVAPTGDRHYSVCMMDEELIEIDVASGQVSRRLRVGEGMQHQAVSGAMADPTCSPTWAEPSMDGRSIFVACNRVAEVLEIDVARWEVVRRIRTGENPYNLATSPDGRYLLVSLRNRTDPALEIFDLQTGERAAHLQTSTTLAHGIAVSSDSRYAFVSVEGVGSEPGKVDIVDLGSLSLVTSVEVAPQATGIAVAP